MSLIRRPSCLLPAKGTDLFKWSVIACDQFTSQPEYWERLEQIVGDAPSTLSLTFPEVYLDKRDKEQRAVSIRATMREYIDRGVLVRHDGYILVRRVTRSGKERLGLMCEVDLEEYDFSPSSTSLIRATEKTVTERLPVRVDIRDGAALELPHIMLLMDGGKDFMRELDLLRGDVLYDTELNMDGGHLTGYALSCDAKIDEYLSSLSMPSAFTAKYGTEDGIAFAVGDGNHSLATAKVCWDKLKRELPSDRLEGHPARYALCELVSLHDASLEFEPIHRVVFDKAGEFAEYARSRLGGESSVKAYACGRVLPLSVPSDAAAAIDAIQRVIDDYCSISGCATDYIHGAKDTMEIAASCGGTAIIMPLISKDDLFRSVITRGVLPRKSFSMGEGKDKRYYMEARLIDDSVSLRAEEIDL